MLDGLKAGFAQCIVVQTDVLGAGLVVRPLTSTIVLESAEIRFVPCHLIGPATPVTPCLKTKTKSAHGRPSRGLPPSIVVAGRT